MKRFPTNIYFLRQKLKCVDDVKFLGCIYVNVAVVNRWWVGFTLFEAMKALRESRGISLLCL
jgi:hypothetical protein